jgi:hypothetical protein
LPLIDLADLLQLNLLRVWRLIESADCLKQPLMWSQLPEAIGLDEVAVTKLPETIGMDVKLVVAVLPETNGVDDEVSLDEEDVC